MSYFSHLDKRKVLHQEHSRTAILPSPHFLWVTYISLFQNDLYSHGEFETVRENCTFLFIKLLSGLTLN